MQLFICCLKVTKLVREGWKTPLKTINAEIQRLADDLKDLKRITKTSMFPAECTCLMLFNCKIERLQCYPFYNLFFSPRLILFRLKGRQRHYVNKVESRFKPWTGCSLVAASIQLETLFTHLWSN